MGSLRFALLNIRKNIKNEKELKSSFITSIIGMAINNIASLTLWYYFGKTVGELNGWQAADIFGLYAFSASSYGIVVSLLSGIYDLPTYISTGSLDKFLSTPKNILVKISASKISTTAFGDLLFGVICLIIFVIWRQLSIVQILLSILLIIVASVIYYSFSLICMSVSFYLMDGENVSSGLFGMFLSNSLYHGGAFTGVLRFIFTFIMPSLLIGAIPVEVVNNISSTNMFMIIILTLIWLLLSILFFYKSLKRYDSNNLFGFGS